MKHEFHNLILELHANLESMLHRRMVVMLQLGV